MDVSALLISLAGRKRKTPDPAPLLVELLPKRDGGAGWSNGDYPFWYRVTTKDSVPFYEIGSELPVDSVTKIRRAVTIAPAPMITNLFCWICCFALCLALVANFGKPAGAGAGLCMLSRA